MDLSTASVSPPLPAEIFRKIFTTASFATVGQPSAAIAFSISHVNRHWRAIALGNAPMWSRIFVTPTDLSLRIVNIFLERSQPCPLEIEFHDDPREDDLARLDIDAVEAMSTLLLAHSGRWKVWIARFRRWDFLEPLLRMRKDAGQKALPALTECWIRYTSTRATAHTHYDLDPCPALRYLSLQGTMPLIYPVQCIQLFHITLSGRSGYLYIINQYQNLQSLELFQTGQKLPPIWGGALYPTLPNLKKAAVSICISEIAHGSLEWDNVFQFFNDVSTPSLTMLAFHIHIAQLNSVSSALLNPKFPQSVKTLTLKASGEEIDVKPLYMGLRSMLRGMPSVNVLCLQGQLETDLLGKSFPGTELLLPDTDPIYPSDALYLPELQTLISHNASAQGLHRLMDARHESGLVEIECLRIVRSDIPDASDRAALGKRVRRVEYFDGVCGDERTSPFDYT